MANEKYINYTPSDEKRKIMVLFTGAGFSKAMADAPVMSEFLTVSEKCLDAAILKGVYAGYIASEGFRFREKPNMEDAYSALKFLEFGHVWSQGRWLIQSNPWHAQETLTGRSASFDPTEFF